MTEPNNPNEPTGAGAEPGAGGPTDPVGPPPPPKSSDDRTIMLILAYLWLFCLIPLLMKKDDAEVQWHAKNGLLMVGAEVALSILFMILMAVPILNIIAFVWCLLGPAILVVHIVAIVKAVKGDRLKLPIISDYVDKINL